MPPLGLSLGVLRAIVFLSTVAVIILGVGNIGMGSYVVYSLNLYRKSLSFPLYYYAIAAIAIAFGVIQLLLAFLGLIGSIKQKRKMLGAFLLILIVMALAQLILGMTLYIVNDQVTVQDYVKENWTKLPTPLVEWIQQKFICCGLIGIPDVVPTCPVASAGFGCFLPFSSWLVKTINWVGLISIISGVCCVMFAVFDGLLFKALKFYDSTSFHPITNVHIEYH